MNKRLRPYKLSEAQVSFIDQVTGLSLPDLTAVSATLRSAEKVIDPDDLRGLLESKVGDDKADALRAVLILIGSGIEDTDYSPSEIWETITLGLDNWEVNEDLPERWEERKQLLLETAQLPVIKNTRKGALLYHKHLYHTHDISILTEARPVFGNDGKSIVDFIVHNVLHLTYSDSDENEKSVEIAFGIDDVEFLRSECERALVKTDTLVSLLSEGERFSPRIYRKRHI